MGLRNIMFDLVKLRFSSLQNFLSIGLGMIHN